jgi:hypothetical protein
VGLWSSGLTGRMGSESSCRLQGTLTLLRRCGAEVGKLAAAVQVGKHVGRLQVTMHLCWWRGVSSAAERREAWGCVPPSGTRSSRPGRVGLLVVEPAPSLQRNWAGLPGRCRH